MKRKKRRVFWLSAFVFKKFFTLSYFAELHVLGHLVSQVFAASQAVFGHSLGQQASLQACFGQVPAAFLASQQTLSQSTGQGSSQACFGQVPSAFLASQHLVWQPVVCASASAFSSQPVITTVVSTRGITISADNTRVFEFIVFSSK